MHKHVVYLGVDYQLCIEICQGQNLLRAAGVSVRSDCGHLLRYFVPVDLVICVLQIQSGELLAAGEFGI